MTTKFSKQHAVGARPGTFVVSETAEPSLVQVIQYSNKKLERFKLQDAASVKQNMNPETITWIDVQGLANHELINELGSVFDFHPLMLADVVNVPQRPKAIAYDDQILVIVRMVWIAENEYPVLEQVSLIVGTNFVVSFQERHGDVLEPVRQRLVDPTSRLRRHGSDYLAYVLIDTIVDGYYPVLEEVGNQLEQLENQVLTGSNNLVLHDLNNMKNRVAGFRRATWPHREAINALIRDENQLVTDEVRLFLRDTYDHVVQTTDVIEMYRETTTGLMNMYLSSVANRTNDVMKVLTVVSTTFIPLTFIAGIYGMNFKHMPELELAWSYPLVLLTMIVIGAGMISIFWRKGWIRWTTRKSWR